MCLLKTLSNEYLLAAYDKAIELNLSDRFIEILLNEISRRGLFK